VQCLGTKFGRFTELLLTRPNLPQNENTFLEKDPTILIGEGQRAIMPIATEISAKLLSNYFVVHICELLVVLLFSLAAVEVSTAPRHTQSSNSSHTSNSLQRSPF
jgi:hypothetical protein